VVSFVGIHSSRFFCHQIKTIASEGASPGFAPGVTTAGTGFQYSVSSGFGRVDGGVVVCCAAAVNAEPAIIEANITRYFIFLGVICLYNYINYLFNDLIHKAILVASAVLTCDIGGIGVE